MALARWARLIPEGRRAAAIKYEEENFGKIEKEQCVTSGDLCIDGQTFLIPKSKSEIGFQVVEAFRHHLGWEFAEEKIAERKNVEVRNDPLQQLYHDIAICFRMLNEDTTHAWPFGVGRIALLNVLNRAKINTKPIVKKAGTAVKELLINELSQVNSLIENILRKRKPGL